MKKFFTLFSASVFCILFTSAIAFGHSTSIVISQVYGGGGGATGTFKKDFVELKNVSNVPQSTAGLSLTYGSATGQFGSSATNYIALTSVTLQPGQYFLILLGTLGTAGADITNFDQTTTNLNMSATNAKVALVNGTFVQNTCGATATPCTLSSTSPSAIGIVDLISYGTANNAEGGTALAALTVTTAGVRASGGCVDTDRNNVDFATATATVPNYTGSTLASCNILDISTANIMPNGTVSTAYTTSFASNGGSGSYTYAVTAGAVPTGLTLNTDGTWSGMPTATGTYNFDVQATDTTAFAPITKQFNKFAPNNANTTTESFEITITAPTAADSSIRGRVLTPTGRGLINANVQLIDTNSGQVRYARTTSLGYFNFRELETGDFYIINVNSKRYVFNSQSFTLNDNIDDLVLIGQ